MFRYLAFGLLFLHISFISFSQTKPQNTSKSRWVDSVYKALPLEEKIAQLMIIRSPAEMQGKDYDTAVNNIRRYNVGGVCFFKGTPYAQVSLVDYYQKIARTPLWFSMDAEWGLAMRLDSIPAFPRQLTLGAMSNDSVVYAMGVEVALQMKKAGIHLDFIPCIDVNSNRSNPVIGTRSFGEDPDNVARKAYMYMKALQDHNIYTSLKHFPGHGDTESDSHVSLPLVKTSQQHIDSVALYPYKYLIKKGADGVMVAHLSVLAYDTTSNLPSSLSPKIVTDLLRKDLGYKGIVYTDGLEMKGITNYFSCGDIAVKALAAGVDVLLLPENVSAAIDSVKSAIDKGIITMDMIEEKCKKVLTAKYNLGLNKPQPLYSQNYDVKAFKGNNFDNISTEIFAEAATLLLNKHNLLPITNVDEKKIADVAISPSYISEFGKTMDIYAKAKHFQVQDKITKSELERFLQDIETYDVVIMTLQGTLSGNAQNNFGISKRSLELVNTISKRAKKTVLCLFANPYVLQNISDFGNMDALVMGYQQSKYAYQTVVNKIFGFDYFRGKLPVTASSQFPLYSGLITSKKDLTQSVPQEAGLNTAYFDTIDMLAQMGITERIYPGCQVLVAKDGNIIYNKAFGTHTYDDTIAVELSDLYDVASITKVMATTLSMMKLYEKGKIDLDKPISTYIPAFKKSKVKGNLTIREIMSHNAGLTAWIPFYKSLIVPDTAPKYFSKVQSDDFPYHVADSLYGTKKMREYIYNRILQSSDNPHKYVYSDIGFYIMAEIILQLTGKTVDEYAAENIYEKLNLTHTTFNPLEKFPRNQIIPTEYDTVFRKQLIQGYVHDPGAALLGGISGHAGLFSNTGDLVILTEMLLQGGTYDGVQIFEKATIDTFNTCYYKGNRRALGFEKPENPVSKSTHVYTGVSPQSFGHTGFTGCLFWADPQYDLIYIFLSNRVCPDASSNKLSKSQIRLKIHEQIYNAVLKK